MKRAFQLLLVCGSLVGPSHGDSNSNSNPKSPITTTFGTRRGRSGGNPSSTPSSGSISSRGKRSSWVGNSKEPLMGNDKRATSSQDDDYALGTSSSLDDDRNLDGLDFYGELEDSDGDLEGFADSILDDDFDYDDDLTGRDVAGNGPESEGKGALYDAYNQLHTLAQDYSKPFDAPAVIVVGHQSSGKSALIEALMGFQFNQVGGGTKTRRPVALRMQYNPKCSHPNCFLVGEDGVERPMSLTEIQDYIEKENRRLEKDPIRSFDSREINVRVEYKYCPNMILIDTPGLISAPKVPKGRSGAGSAFANQRALQASAREAERLVVEKMQCQDYIILCVEDTNDWKHGTTREVVQKADPDLSRTVIVNTKLDTKMPQFGTPSDLEEFLRAPLIDRLSPHKMGGPFYTSVPSGRVGRSGTSRSSGDFLFETDEDFVEMCGEAESADRSVVADRLRRCSKNSKKNTKSTDSAHLLNRVGLSHTRGFLEQRVDECYRRNVAKIIPILQSEYTATERRLEAIERELEALSVERLKAGADNFSDEFCNCLRKALQGSVVAPATLFGESLSQETSAGGSFHDVQGAPMSVSDRTWDRLVETDVGNSEHRLYGGAQYHRTLREFNLATKCLRLPTITEDEIANAAGVGTTHDGVNFLHASCVISLEKARVSFEPMLEALRFRVEHVMDRICPVTEYMLKETQERARISTSYEFEGSNGDIGGNKGVSDSMDISQNPQFRQLLRSIYEKFVKKCSGSAMSKCRDDLASITRYVTWNLDDRSSGALQRSLPDQTDLVSIYQVALKSRSKANAKGEKESDKEDKSAESALTRAPPTLNPIPDSNRNEARDYSNLMQLMEEAVCTRDANRTNLVVSGLVQHIVSGWRETFARSVTTKFNCYFMLPFVDDFHKYLRLELQKVYSGDGDSLYDVFDIRAARRGLQKQQQKLSNECEANKRLQDKFQKCAIMMRKQQDSDATSHSSTSSYLGGSGESWNESEDDEFGFGESKSNQQQQQPSSRKRRY